jgi:hypothetical protein
MPIADAVQEKMTCPTTPTRAAGRVATGDEV